MALEDDEFAKKNRLTYKLDEVSAAMDGMASVCWSVSCYVWHVNACATTGLQTTHHLLYYTQNTTLCARDTSHHQTSFRHFHGSEPWTVATLHT